MPASAWQVDPDYTIQTDSQDKRLIVLGGPVGLRPEAMREVRLSLGISAAQWRDVYSDMRVLEAEAVKCLRTRAK